MQRPMLTALLCSAIAAPAAAQAPSQGATKIPAPPQQQPDQKLPAPAPTKLPAVNSPVRAARDLRVPTKADASPLPPAATAGAGDLPAAVLHDDGAGAGVLHALGHTYKAHFDRTGAAYVPFLAGAQRNHPLHFAVQAARVGDTAIAVEPAEPVRNGERVSFAHGGLRATYDLQLGGVEQMFWFDRLPARGDLRLDVAFTTDLQVEPAADGLHCRGEGGEAVIGLATAVDARGARLPVEVRHVDGVLQFTVPAAFVAAAALPLCIDPLVSSSQLAYADTPARPAQSSDIAYEPTYGEYQVCMERYWSFTDRDVFVRRFDSNMNPLTLVIVDVSSTESWELPKIAANNVADRFLVVAQVSAAHASPFWIAGRMVDANTGLTGATIMIENAAVAGHAAGDKLNPDVGGDPDYSAPTYFTVVWERAYSATDHDIHMKQVDVNGNLRAVAPTLVDNSLAFDHFPTISKTDGTPPYATQCWGITWQRTFSPSDEDVYAALVRWDGTITVPTFTVDAPSGFQVEPSISSPSDEVGGARYYVVAFEDPSGTSSTITARVVDQAGGLHGRYDVANQVTPGWPHAAASVDCDGARFAVAWHEVYGGSGQDFDVRVAACAFDLAGGLLLQDSAAPAFTTDLESLVEVTSTHAAGSGTGRYGLTWTRRVTATNNTYSVYAGSYDGVQAGTTQTTRSTACGANANFTLLGALYLGGSIYAAQTSPAGLVGYLVGLPQSVPIPGCGSCILGVAGDTYLADPITLRVPNLPGLVGLTIAIQGFQFATGPCYGVSLSDTVDVTVR